MKLKFLLNNLIKLAVFVSFICLNTFCFGESNNLPGDDSCICSDWINSIINETVNEASKKIKKDTDLIFANAIHRVNYFVEKIYEKRSDQDFWKAEFNRLVLEQKSLDSVFKNINTYYRSDLKKVLEKIAEKMREIKVANAMKIKISASASKDLKQLKNSLPTAEEIANDIYVDLDKKKLNENTIVEYIKEKLENLKVGNESEGENSESLKDAFLMVVKDPEKGLAIFLAPIHFLAEMSVDYSMEEYKIKLTQEIRFQRNNYHEIIKNGYMNLLMDNAKRMENIINNAIEAYGKGADNVIP